MEIHHPPRASFAAEVCERKRMAHRHDGFQLLAGFGAGQQGGHVLVQRCDAIVHGSYQEYTGCTEKDAEVRKWKPPGLQKQFSAKVSR
jgi:hypothetical protein